MERLLSAGAKVNNIGYANGESWEDDRHLGVFGRLFGLSPLYVLKNDIKIRDWYDYRKNIPADEAELKNKLIEKLLLQYGGEPGRD